MGYFSGVPDARGSAGGIWFLCLDKGGEANYRVRVDRCLATKTRNNEPNFIIETTVITSTHPQRPPGSHPSQAIVLNRGASADAAPGNVADFCRVGLAALSNLVLSDALALAREGKAVDAAKYVPDYVAELEQWNLGAVTRTGQNTVPGLGALVLSCQQQGIAVDAALVVLSEQGVENWIGGEGNPLSGIELNVAAFNKPKRNGDPFTRVVWSVPGDVASAARRAA